MEDAKLTNEDLIDEKMINGHAQQDQPTHAEEGEWDEARLETAQKVLKDMYIQVST